MIMKSVKVAVDVGIDRNMDQKYGVVSYVEMGRRDLSGTNSSESAGTTISATLLLDFNAAYLVHDSEYGSALMRGYTQDKDDLPFKTEMEIAARDFSAHHETGTLKDVFDWIVDQGRGRWAMDHSMDPVKRTHTFVFYFEDEMTGVWSKMQFN